MLLNTLIECWSGDGQTFLRKFVLKIPIPTSAYTENHDYNFGQWVNDAATAASFMNVLNCPYDGAVYFNGTNWTQNAAAHVDTLEDFGFQTVADLAAIANNNAFRLKFYNDNYIIFEHGPDPTVNWQLRYCLGVNDNTVATVLFPNDNVCTTPFPLIDENFQCIDGQLRWATTWIPSNQMYGCYVKIAQNTDLSQWFDGIKPYDPEDPYPNMPDSGPSGPAEGVGIPTSDAVDIPSLPSFSATDTGFVTLFNPTLAQVKDLADYMWNGLFDINNFKKIFADPMDCILGFNMVPVAVPSGSAMNINIGNIVTSVSMNVATSQWVELNCGSIDIGLPYGSYLDFSPYTKFSIYLPYIGTCELSADDVAGQVLTLKYHVDALSCACVAYLKCGDHVLYQWTGSCGYSIPVTQNDFSRMIMAIANIAAAGIGGAVVGGAGAAIVNAGAAAAKNVSALKPEVHRSGAIGSSAGLMGGQTPYLIIEIPQACKPEKQYHYTGYPGFITVTVGDLSGYAEFEEIILDGIGCTEEERSMIDSLCKGGIYV